MTYSLIIAWLRTVWYAWLGLGLGLGLGLRLDLVHEAIEARGVSEDEHRLDVPRHLG